MSKAEVASNILVIGKASSYVTLGVDVCCSYK